MPQMKRKTSGVEPRRPLGVYDGPVPREGNYPGVIRACTLRTFGTGTQAWNVLVELESEEGTPKAEFNGYPGWTTLFLGENEHQIAREGAFYLAVCDNPDPTIVLDSEKTKAGKSTDQKVLKIGGVNPIGTKVRVDLRLDDEYEGVRRLKGDTIYKVVGGAKLPSESAPTNEDPDADVTIEAEAKPMRKLASVPDPAPATSGGERGGRFDTGHVGDTVDYHALSLPKLKLYAKEHGVDPAQSKAALLEDLDSIFDASKPSEASDEDVTQWDDDAFWAFAKSKYEPGDISEDDPRDDIVDMLVEDKFLIKNGDKLHIAPPF